METRYLIDLDGTVTSVELLPVIARELGIEEEIADLTTRTMAGEVPFDVSFRRRVSMLGRVPVARVADILMDVPLHEQFLSWIKANRDRCWVVTGNLDCWVEPWIRAHGLRGFTSSARVEDGLVSVDRILRKESVLADFQGFRTVFVGDGANDAQAISLADVGVACALVHSAAPVVMEVADYLVLEEGSLCHLLSRL